MNDLIFYSRPHFLPVNCRKSRSNWFSIFSRLISYACFATRSRGTASLRGRPLGQGVTPAIIFSSFLRSRLSKLFTTYLFANPKCSAISRCVFPAATIALISGSKACTCSYLRLDIFLPPDVVFPFSYIRGYFVYCPFLLDLFIVPRGFFSVIFRQVWLRAAPRREPRCACKIATGTARRGRTGPRPCPPRWLPAPNRTG